MDPDALIPIVMFAIFIGGTAVVLFFGRRAGLERNARMRELAARTGLEYTESTPWLKFMPGAPHLTGHIGARHASILEVARGSGKSRTYWTVARMQCNNAGPLQLTLRTQGTALFEKLAGAFGYKDIAVGDARFDSVFAVHGNDEAFVQAALIPEIREKLIAFWPRARSGRIRIENSEVSYEEQASLTSARARENAEKALAVLPDLAAIAEVYRT